MPKLIVYQLNAVCFQFAVESLRSGKIYAGSRIMTVQIKSRSHPRSEYIFSFTGKSEFLQTRNIICSGPGGIVCQINITFPEIGQPADQFYCTGIYNVTQVQSAVHIKYSDTVFNRNKVSTVLVGDSFHLIRPPLSCFAICMILYSQFKKCQDLVFLLNVLPFFPLSDFSCNSDRFFSQELRSGSFSRSAGIGIVSEMPR